MEKAARALCTRPCTAVGLTPAQTRRGAEEGGRAQEAQREREEDAAARGEGRWEGEGGDSVHSRSCTELGDRLAGSHSAADRRHHRHSPSSPSRLTQATNLPLSVHQPTLASRSAGSLSPFGVRWEGTELRDSGPTPPPPVNHSPTQQPTAGRPQQGLTGPPVPLARNGVDPDAQYPDRPNRRPIAA